MVKKILIITFIGLAIVAAWWMNALWFKPISIDTFFERTYREQLALSPQTQIRTGTILSYGSVADPATHLDDQSRAGRQAKYDLAAEHLAFLHEYDRDDLDPEQQISYDVLEYEIEETLETERWDGYDFPINPLFGVQTALLGYVESSHSLKTPGDFADFSARLDALALAFNQFDNDLQERAERDLLMPRFGLVKTAEQARSLIAGGAKETGIYKRFAKQLAEADLAGVQRLEWQQTIVEQLDNHVIPSIERLAETALALSEQVDDTPGIWRLPDGDAYYQHILKVHTTTNLTAQEIHDLGLAEVTRLQGDIMRILRNQEYAPADATDEEAGDYLARMSADERFLYEDSTAGREQVMEDYRALIDDVKTYLASAFNRSPQQDVAVERVPEFREQSAPGAYYSYPAVDGSRPGTFYVNLYNIQDAASFAMKTLAAHEGIPGHHFQASLNRERDNLPTFRTQTHNSAYVEGWALYAEHLVADLGWYDDDPFADVGRLQAELFRAVRLVVDTGMHHLRWDREQSINYMQRTTGMTRSSVVAEVERYAIIPGQATSFKIGMMKMLELRQRARQQLGNRFDLAEFHEVVLNTGSVPLAVLEDVVERYIEANLTETSANNG